MKKLIVMLMASTLIAAATEATQLPAPTKQQQVKVAFYGLALGWLAFPGLVAGDAQWLSLSKKGQCDADHNIKIYMPLPVQYDTEQEWTFAVPCDKWPNNNNVVVRSER